MQSHSFFRKSWPKQNVTDSRSLRAGGLGINFFVSDCHKIYVVQFLAQCSQRKNGGYLLVFSFKNVFSITSKLSFNITKPSAFRTSTIFKLLARLVVTAAIFRELRARLVSAFGIISNCFLPSSSAAPFNLARKATKVLVFTGSNTTCSTTIIFPCLALS